MAPPHESRALLEAIIFLAASVVCVPLFARARLGAILGYLFAGVLIGPHILRLIGEPEAVMQLAEFGVVLVLFVIGLELRPQRLWALRQDIFGLGSLQVGLTGITLAALGIIFGGLDWRPALVVGFGLALSSTAFAMQIYKERGTLNTPAGERAFSILLLQDMAIVPLLALVAFLSGGAKDSMAAGWQTGLVTVAAVGGIILVGRYGLPLLFRVIVASGAREVLTAAALLVVVGAAAIMQALGISMALGAFIAGVVLADSEFRHQLEADIEPFRGLLLGLFFISVGMGLDVGVLFSAPLAVVVIALGLMATKALIVFVLARGVGSNPADARNMAGTLSQAGEFGFVLFAAASATGLMSSQLASLLSAAITLTMALTPLAARLGLMGRRTIDNSDMPDGPRIDGASDQRVIVAGYGRFGQVVGQMLLARGVDVVFIDPNPAQIRLTRRFGQRVYFGEGWRLDMLRAAGADTARAIILCHGQQEVTADRIAAIRMEFPNVQILVRAYDRRHVMELSKADADFVIREMFESAVAMGREALRRLAVDAEIVDIIEEEYRRRDASRLAAQLETGEMTEARELIFRPGAALRTAAFDIGPTEGEG